MTSPDEFFGGGPKNPPALRFYPGPQVKFRPPDIGYQTGGQILSIQVRQQRDYDTGQPKTWPDGNPMLQAEMILQTNQNTGVNEYGDPDDGKRTLYVQGQMKNAISQAVRDSGDATGNPKPGGIVTVWCLSTFDEVKRIKKNTWAATYRQGSLPQETQQFFNGNAAPQQQMVNEAHRQHAAGYTSNQQGPTQAQRAYAQSAPAPSMLEQIRNSQAGPNPAFQDEEAPF